MEKSRSDRFRRDEKPNKVSAGCCSNRLREDRVENSQRQTKNGCLNKDCCAQPQTKDAPSKKGQNTIYICVCV
jgi:hypothetical protein